MPEVYCMCNTSVFIATFYLHSHQWYQTSNYLRCYIISWGKILCAVQAALPSLKVWRNLVPCFLKQWQYYSVITLSILLGKSTYAVAACQQPCISHGSTHRLCFSSLLRTLASILVQWWGRDSIHYSGFPLCVFSPLICFDTCRTYSRDDSCPSSRNTPLVPSVTSANRREGWLLTENCHTDLGPLLVLFSKPFKPHSADIQICFDTLRRKNFSPLHLKNLRGDTNGLLVSDVVVLLVFFACNKSKRNLFKCPIKN